MKSHPSIRPDGRDWQHAARRVRHLHRGQVVAVAVLALLALAVAAFLGRAALAADAERHAALEETRAVANLHVELSNLNTAYWRGRAHGRSGVARATRRRFALAERHAQALAAVASAGTEAERAGVHATLAALVRLHGLVARSLADHRQGSALDRRLLRAAGPAVDRLGRGLDAWLRAERTHTDAATATASSRHRRLTVWLLLLIAAIVAAGVVVWALTDRARGRIVAALEDAAAQLGELAATDPLTGLANHRVFHDRLAGEAQRARRHGRPLALVLLDLDHFKHVNEVHGHQAGDEVLLETARRLQSIARGGELLARVGGEEFAWLLPETDGDGAYAAAERARDAIAGAPYPGVGDVTASAGACDVRSARSAAELYRLADGALYWSKVNGRNITFLYSPTIVTELSAEERTERLERAQALAAVRALARAVDVKDPSTQSHQQRSAELAERLAVGSGWAPERAALLREASLMHDVGKIGVPDAVLFKPGRLTAEEYRQVQAHAALSATIAAEVLTAEQVGWIRAHHERFDGRGYPSGLAGAQIPEGARLLAVADSFDVMTNARHYKEPMSVEEAIAECRRQAGLQFCPAAVSALAALLAADAAAPAERLAA